MMCYDIISYMWTSYNFVSYDIDHDILNDESFKCKSQCHTQPMFGNKQADIVYILKNIDCSNNIFENENKINETYGGGLKRHYISIK